MPDDNTGGSAAGTTNNSESARRGPTDEGRGVARKLLQRFRGRAEEALAQLADENKDLRVERRELREKVTKFDAPGTVVLTGDDAKAYTEYKALGAPADLKKIVEEVPTLRKKVTDTERAGAAREAAKLLGWNEDALAGMIGDKGLEVSFVDGQDKDGKAIKIPHVKPATDKDAKPERLADYVPSKAAYMTAALSAKAEQRTQGATTGNTQSAAGTQQHQGAHGTQFVEQKGGTSAGTAPGATPTNNAIPGRRPYMTPGQRAKAAGGNT